MCPIKLLLVLALRTGAVAETRIESLLSNVTARASRRVVWKHPKRPVLAKFAVKGSWLLLDEAASNHHMVGVVHTVSRIAGLLRYVHPHDFRRGSARDLSHLPRSALKDANIQAVGRGMGHDVRSGHRTLEYIGDDTNDTWTARVENPYQGKVRAIPLATISYKQPKVSREMCGQWCLEQGLDARLNKNIDKARLAIEKQQWVDWMESELEARDRVQHESLDSSSGPQSNAAAPKNSRKRHIVIDDELKAQAPKDSRKRRVVLDSGDEDEASGAFEGQPPESSSSHAQEGLEMDEHLHLSFDDPQELDADEIAHAETLIDTIGKSKMSLDEGDENVLLEALAHTADVEETSDTISGDSFDTDAVSFVSKYATINVFAFHGKRVTVGDERMKKMSGNGKDEPVQFAYMYKNKGFGCDKNFVTAWELLRHEEICKPSKIQLLNSAPNTVLCEICGSSLSSEKNKKTHVRNMHNWNPRACPYKGCESTQVGKTLHHAREALTNSFGRYSRQRRTSNFIKRTPTFTNISNALLLVANLPRTSGSQTTWQNTFVACTSSTMKI